METQSNQEDLQALWDQEASKLEAGDSSPAAEREALAPGDLVEDETLPQETDETQPQAEPEPEQVEDPLAGLPQVVRDKLSQIDQLAATNAQLLHHIKTAEGRVAAMQREFQQARVAQQTVAPQEAPSQGQIATAAKNPEKWEQLKTDFPEWASAMEEYVAAKIGSVKPQQPGVDPQAVAAYVQQQVAQSKAEMARVVEEARIEGKYDDWRNTVNTTEFAQWFVAQKPEIRQLADSPQARDAIRMLDLYHQAKSRSASDVKQERGARLAAAATARPGQTPPPKTLDDMSVEDLWNYEAAKRDKTRSQRGF